MQVLIVCVCPCTYVCVHVCACLPTHMCAHNYYREPVMWFVDWTKTVRQKFDALLSFQVTFTNEQSGEFQFYEVQLRSTKPGVIATIDLSTPVRQSVPHTIRLDNPLAYPLTFNAICNIPEVLMPTSLSVPAQSQVSFASSVLAERE